MKIFFVVACVVPEGIAIGLAARPFFDFVCVANEVSPAHNKKLLCSERKGEAVQTLMQWWRLVGGSCWAPGQWWAGATSSSSPTTARTRVGLFSSGQQQQVG